MEQSELGHPESRGRLFGRKLIVTGAASGIGLATAELFYREGAIVTGLDLAAPDDASFRTAMVDVTDRTNVDKAVSAAAIAMEGLDGIVNAAGIIAIGPFLELGENDVRRLLDVNLVGPINVCRAAIPHLMRASHATIVNVSSAAGLIPVPNSAVYSASKGGLIAFSKGLAAELAPSVRVNVVAPGGVDTPMIRNRYGGEIPPEMNKRYPLGRLADAAEIADAILFLTGPESTYISGATLAVDGARTFH